MALQNNNLELFENAIKFSQTEPELLRGWLSLYGVEVKLLKPRKDSKDVELYQKAFGNVALDSTPEYYEYQTISALIHDMDYTKYENGFDTQILTFFSEKLSSSDLIEMEYLDKVYTFIIEPDSIQAYSNLIYRFNIRINKVRDVDNEE